MTKISTIPLEAKRMGIFISNLWNAITFIESRGRSNHISKGIINSHRNKNDG